MSEHTHSIAADWYEGSRRPVKFTKDNATFCSVCGMVLAYSYKGMSHVSRDYWAELDRQLHAIQVATPQAQAQKGSDDDR